MEKLPLERIPCPKCGRGDLSCNVSFIKMSSRQDAQLGSTEISPDKMIAKCGVCGYEKEFLPRDSQWEEK